MYARAIKDIKIQFYTQQFKLYHSTTIKERGKKTQSINQYTNTRIIDKIIYKKNILVILVHKLIYWSNKFNNVIAYKAARPTLNSSFKNDEALIHSFWLQVNYKLKNICLG